MAGCRFRMDKPVAAVTKVVSEGKLPIRRRNTRDFPVPADPVKKMFFLLRTALMTRF